ncbi:tetratricopeptide-like helical [Fusarium subglutinans]|uniref:Tetratricopeptide-like helical n=1 Tax=Gibberella subglutinans TaxID=42677 RepID=A0A8H5Q127_GIBSU|nr:tetratricopeptide-like helical [Fusarium subglutinans]KAF5606654.1 tetratricopeptide-like helical [Fusarium subglutinans]
MIDETVPSEKELKRFFEKDALCWEKANLVLEKTRAAKIKKRKKLKKTIKDAEVDKTIQAPNDAQPLRTVETVDELIQMAKETYVNYQRQRGAVEKVFLNIASYFERHSQIIDVFIQQEPKFTALVWGSIRYLLQVVVDCKEASEVTANGIFLIAQHAERWSRMAKSFGEKRRVEEATVDLYYHVLDFLHSAIERFRRDKLARLQASFFNNTRQEFEKKVAQLQSAAARLDKEVDWEEQTKMITEAMLAYDVQTGACKMRMDISQIHDCISPLASPIASRPQGFDVAASDAQPKWLTTHPTYQKWLVNKFPSPLWIVGKPGVGKSALAHQTSSTLSQSGHTVFTHAFQSNASSQKRDRASFPISILTQLLPSTYPVQDFQEQVFTKLVPSYYQYKSRFEDCPFEQLWPHCVTLLEKEREFVLLIDAIDECNFGNRGQAEELLECFQQVLDRTSGKIAIFSRPNDMFGFGTSSRLHMNEIRITKEDILPQIMAFCDTALSKLKFTEEMKLQVTSRLKRDANSFLWATKLLQQFKTTLKMGTFEAILENWPNDIWGIYTNVWLDRLSSLDDESKSSCQDIFLMLLGARRDFKIDELDDALGFIPDSGIAQFITSTHCQPLIQVVDGSVSLSHASVRDFLLSGGIGDTRFSKSAPDATLARKCLEFLIREAYASQDRIGQRLRKNIGVGGSDPTDDETFYEYAARYWYIHLTALSSPDQSLLELANKFLHLLQFAHWAEYSIRDIGDFQAIRSTEMTLTVWLKSLSHRDRSLIHLDDYFEFPYRKLARVFKDYEEDKELQWLALMHLGFYYFDKGRMAEMAEVRRKVAAGLKDLLGPRHPLALRAAADAAYTFLFNNELPKAQRLYAELAYAQREVGGPDDASSYFTLVFKAQAEYLMLDSPKALNTLTDSLEGLFRILGPQSNGYLIAQLWYAVANASAGHIEQGIKLLEFVRDKRKEQYGPKDSFGVTTQIFLGDLYRKLGSDEGALQNIQPALGFRRSFWHLSHFLTLDTALILAITYRDFGREDESAEIIEELENNGRLDREQNIIRACQVKHMRALWLFEDGQLDKSIGILELLLLEIDEKYNNRALQWVRLDLAYMLRYRGRDGDEGTADSLFDGIVADEANDPDDEPDPPRWLEIAERALKLLRKGNTDGANDLLGKEKLRWAREESLWMWLGMPAADTGWMRLPKGLGDDNM